MSQQKPGRELARLVKRVELYITPDQVPPRERAAVESEYVVSCKTEFPTVQSVRVYYRTGPGNRGFVELAGELKDRRPEEDMQTAVILYAFALFDQAVSKAAKRGQQP